MTRAADHMRYILVLDIVRKLVGFDLWTGISTEVLEELAGLPREVFEKRLLSSLQAELITDRMAKSLHPRTRIDNMALSMRLRNCLRNNNIVTLEDLLYKTPFEIRKIVGLGKTSFRELEEFLAKNGRKLGELSNS